MPSSPADLVPPSASADDARRAADEILSRPEYREPEPSLVERVLEAIGEFLGETIATLTGSGPGGVVATVVVVALAALAAWFLLRSLGARPRRDVAGEPLAQGTRAVDDPGVWLAEAQRLAGEGDHRGALRCRYQAAVATLLRAGVADDIPGRTPRELADELLALAPASASQVRAVTDEFERAWYGGEPVDAGRYERFADGAATMERLRPSMSPQAQEVGA